MTLWAGQNRENTEKALGNAEIVGTFLLSVRAIKFTGGNVITDVHAKNKNLPMEIVLMHVKAWLHNKEQRYYEWFANEFGDSLQP